MTPKIVFATTSIEKSKVITPEKFACGLLPAEGKSITFEDLCKLETLRDVKGSNIYTKSVTLKRITYSYM